MGSTFFGLVDMGLLGLPSLISYFILFSCPLHPIWSIAFVQTVNWGDGQYLCADGQNFTVDGQNLTADGQNFTVDGDEDPWREVYEA